MFWSAMLHAQPFRKDVLRVERLEKLPAAAVWVGLCLGKEWYRAASSNFQIFKVVGSEPFGKEASSKFNWPSSQKNKALLLF